MLGCERQTSGSLGRNMFCESDWIFHCQKRTAAVFRWVLPTSGSNYTTLLGMHRIQGMVEPSSLCQDWAEPKLFI
ncbi:hypothetical protein XELAEV_18044258mg [Xenopus laevis]|uniref:Uncharacterized protein n=1 Tax=Xenopus laevis TaxID=8355 RepID=A0A974BYF3_XENLA|nr:hypothetical protein XELAEV_18044258mg [Xenopus laevis]